MPPKKVNPDRKTQKEIEQEIIIKKLQNIHNIMLLKNSQSRFKVSKANENMREMTMAKHDMEIDAILSVDELESVIHALITSLKTFQAQSKANLYEVQSQLQATERKLKDSENQLKFVNEKLEALEKELNEAKKAFEIDIQAMHISYVKILEENFDKIRDSFKEAVANDTIFANEFHETFQKAFKSLEITQVWKKV